MIDRPLLVRSIETAIERSPVTCILGPRQCGKTTVGKMVAYSIESTYYDLENPVDAAALDLSAMTTLQNSKGLIVIDEIQRQPNLFPILRVLADDQERPFKFLILGSANPHLVKGTSESLAGRVEFIDMSGFQLDEVGVDSSQKLWLRGCFPPSFLAKDDASSDAWRSNYLRSLLERDIPQLGISIPAETLRRFWTMLAHYHGRIWNAAPFSSSLGLASPTIGRYLDILTGAYMLRRLAPWHENIKKRQMKAPKIYVRDSGLLHTLLSLNGHAILTHPMLGASWEGFVIEQIAMKLAQQCYYWGTHAGAELDILVLLNGKRYGFEIKYADAPRLTKSMTIALDDLGLEKIFIVFPGNKSYAVDEKIAALCLRDLPDTLIELQH